MMRVLVSCEESKKRPLINIAKNTEWYATCIENHEFFLHPHHPYNLGERYLILFYVANAQVRIH